MLVRQLCHIEVSLHLSVAVRECDPSIGHIPSRLQKVKDCVYCKLTSGVGRQTTRHCRKCEAPLCVFTRECFQKFHNSNFMDERTKRLTKKSATPTEAAQVGRPKGSKVEKGRGKRKRKNW